MPRAILLFSLLLLTVFIGVNQVLAREADVENINLNLNKNEIAITFFDLSDGEATLLQNQTGETVLINTGAPSAGEELISRLKMYGIKKVDWLLFSNFDPLYTGNIKRIIEQFSVGTLLGPEHLKKQLRSYSPEPETKIATFEVKKPFDLFPGLKASSFYVSENGQSVLSFQYGKHRMLYMGFADKIVEEKLKDEENIKSALLKVADFGSGSGTTQPFLEAVDPQVAIIFKKKKEMPNDQVMERLLESWTDVYNTYRMGSVTIKMDEETYKVFTVPTKRKRVYP
ncbi:ComEC/Rec2 family competence protein [Pseudalkalibacillus caeni]|uniref:Hydrolase n=1 Tax=Exobacillus caeni TaxID=2574798 RepID=A0A5R9F5X7_9BACL|nr:hypothetical protein [Pseudalkalibacillus caeni]TLS35884.1 hypothetical protein FCL54_17965 [Pseudalkalibacillus caeni]